MLKVHFIENDIPDDIHEGMEKEFAMICLDSCHTDYKMIKEIDERRFQNNKDRRICKYL
mgnify:FL=1